MFGSGNYEEALKAYSQLADMGDVGAVTALAHMHLKGEGTTVDHAKGLEMLKLACSLGDRYAAFSLGAFHRSGNYGVSIDLEKSREYFLLAKELGFVELDVTKFL